MGASLPRHLAFTCWMYGSEHRMTVRVAKPAQKVLTQRAHDDAFTCFLPCCPRLVGQHGLQHAVRLCSALTADTAWQQADCGHIALAQIT